MTQRIIIKNPEDGGPYTIKVTETKYKETSINFIKPGQEADYWIYDGVSIKIEEK